MFKDDKIVLLFNKIILKYSANFQKINFHCGEIINLIFENQNENGSIEQQLVKITNGRLYNQEKIKQIAIKAGYNVDEKYVICVNN